MRLVLLIFVVSFGRLDPYLTSRHVSPWLNRLEGQASLFIPLKFKVIPQLPTSGYRHLLAPARHQIWGRSYGVCTSGGFSISSFNTKALSASRTAMLHEIGHQLGARHDRAGVMQSHNNGSTRFSRRSMKQIVRCYERTRN